MDTPRHPGGSRDPRERRTPLVDPGVRRDDARVEHEWTPHVIPAEAGIHANAGRHSWIPAFAGMTAVWNTNGHPTSSRRKPGSTRTPDATRGSRRSPG